MCYVDTKTQRIETGEIMHMVILLELKVCITFQICCGVVVRSRLGDRRSQVQNPISLKIRRVYGPAGRWIIRRGPVAGVVQHTHPEPAHPTGPKAPKNRPAGIKTPSAGVVRKSGERRASSRVVLVI
ncbi:hypothetical protein AVEN_269496-1 [Araneus ventricosus]|uniref:Uncharacterized protein n=1 Tax=Araneus ventricosus TaxID=182803 RepID=A0A4Y2S1X4_ARAVE|nr:hypothetical protein AVEN_269496-1 [Araneus ventricosus]